MLPPVFLSDLLVGLCIEAAEPAAQTATRDAASFDGGFDADEKAGCAKTPGLSGGSPGSGSTEWGCTAGVQPPVSKPGLRQRRSTMPAACLFITFHPSD